MKEQKNIRIKFKYEQETERLTDTWRANTACVLHDHADPRLPLELLEITHSRSFRQLLSTPHFSFEAARSWHTQCLFSLLGSSLSGWVFDSVVSIAFSFPAAPVEELRESGDSESSSPCPDFHSRICGVLLQMGSLLLCITLSLSLSQYETHLSCVGKSKQVSIFGTLLFFSLVFLVYQIQYQIE